MVLLVFWRINVRDTWIELFFVVQNFVHIVHKIYYQKINLSRNSNEKEKNVKIILKLVTTN
jgi:hypothetical protein